MYHEKLLDIKIFECCENYWILKYLDVKKYLNFDDTLLHQKYQNCLSLFKSFRTVHLSIVHDYIVNNIKANNNSNNVHLEGGTSGLGRFGREIKNSDSDDLPLVIILKKMINHTNGNQIHKKQYNCKSNYLIYFFILLIFFIGIFFF